MIALIKVFFVFAFEILVAAFAPVIALRQTDSVWQRRGVIVIHTLFLAGLFSGLTVIQVRFQLETFVRSSLPFVRACWLPMVGILGYATIWSAWFVARTLRQPDEKPLFDSVASALKDGLDRFTRAGIDPRRTPLYLVLGAPVGGVREFFSSAHVDLAVLPSAEEADEPVQVCGNRDAIYVCCRDSSLLGHYARKSASSLLKVMAERCAVETGSMASTSDQSVTGLRRGGSVPAWRSGVAANGNPTAAMLSPSAHDVAPQSTCVLEMNPAINATATEASSATATLAWEPGPVDAHDSTIQRVEHTLGVLDSIATGDGAPCLSKQKVAVLQPRTTRPAEIRLDAGDAEEMLERLQTLCQEIVSLREPYCPINGIIAMIPLPACDNMESSDHIGMRLERDLKTIVDATDTQLSVQVIYCDLDLCEGSQPFLDRFPESQRHRRLGAIIPAVPASESESSASSIDHAVQWICNDLFTPLGYRLMVRDMQNATSDRDLCMGNHRIQRLVHQMRGRRDGMSRMLRRSVAGLGNRLRIRGCFVAATGMAGHASKQAFCAGIVPMILDMQNEVQWSAGRRVRDRWQRTAALATYVVVVTLASITATLFLASGSD